MNESKAARIEQALNGIARKVFDCVPIAEPWSVHRIATELARTSGSTPDLRIVHGCMAKLLDLGLVRLVGKDGFQRIKPRARIETDHEGELMQANEPRPLAATGGGTTPAPMDRLARLAQQLRTDAERLLEMARELDDAALDAEAQIERVRADSAKLRQLQALLKGLGE